MADSKVVSFFPLLFIGHLVLPGVSAEVCAPVNHDIKVLKERQYWQFERPEVKGCSPLKIQSANSSTCIFYFSICQPVPRYCPESSGICLANKITFYEGNKTSILYTPFAQTGSSEEEFTSGANHFILKFGPGEPMGQVFLFPPVTQLRFQCDKNATWEQSLLDGKVDQYLVNITYGSNPLEIQYNIVFNYSGACKHGGGGGGGSGDDEGPSDVLSVGSILLILFFPGMFLYCVVGALINKGAGKTGKEMIPNSKFWSDLPGLISDGISFVIAKITCSQMSTSQESYDRM